mmetsp:Transcript_95951/g.268001  ORF Transcript_95951/g.268001 Transcript_95951/m.268001 type:complete len:208 (+) Transcript_95951:268-891(+)
MLPSLSAPVATYLRSSGLGRYGAAYGSPAAAAMSGSAHADTSMKEKTISAAREMGLRSAARMNSLSLWGTCCKAAAVFDTAISATSRSARTSSANASTTCSTKPLSAATASASRAKAWSARSAGAANSAALGFSFIAVRTTSGSAFSSSVTSSSCLPRPLSESLPSTHSLSPLALCQPFSSIAARASRIRCETLSLLARVRMHSMRH